MRRGETSPFDLRGRRKVPPEKCCDSAEEEEDEMARQGREVFTAASPLQLVYIVAAGKGGIRINGRERGRGRKRRKL